MIDRFTATRENSDMEIPDMQIVELPYATAELVLQGTVEEQARTLVEHLLERVKNRKCDRQMLEYIWSEVSFRFGKHVDRIFVKPPGSDHVVWLGLFNGEVDAREFEWRFGFKPRQDDLHRVNCDQAGEPGHSTCGICPRQDQPTFLSVLCLREIGERI